MQSKPLVSVLMTAYNREKYIAEAIESVLSSTYQNWELIIVDDQSKDRSVEIAKSYEEKDKRIKVYINEKNLGDYPNRNKAASYAKGKYLKYVDADDLIYPYGLEQLVFYMEQFPEAGYGLCSLEQDKESVFPFRLSPKEAYYRHYIKKIWLFHKAPLSSIIKKEKFNDVGGFSGKQHLGDFELWNILSQKYNVVLMPHGIVWHRSHNEQQMKIRMSNPIKQFNYLKTQLGILENIKCPLSPKDNLKAIKSTKKQQARFILRHLKTHGIKTALYLQKMANSTIFQIVTNAFLKI